MPPKPPSLLRAIRVRRDRPRRRQSGLLSRIPSGDILQLPSFPGFIEPLCFLVVRLFKGDRKTGYGYEASKASKLEDFRFLPYTTYEFQNLELALGCMHIHGPLQWSVAYRSRKTLLF